MATIFFSEPVFQPSTGFVVGNGTRARDMHQQFAVYFQAWTEDIGIAQVGAALQDVVEHGAAVDAARLSHAVTRIERIAAAGEQQHEHGGDDGAR